MNALYEHLQKHAVVYVTRDIERALGLPLPTNGYYIVSNKTTASLEFHARAPDNIVLIEGEDILDTHELLERPEARDLIKKTRGNVLVFKNTPLIERICEREKLNLLNPSATLAQKVEDKISQIAWLGELAAFLPPHEITACKELRYDKQPYIIQFNHAHSGEGTALVKNKAELELLRKKFPNRDVRKTDFIAGPIFTNNNIVTDSGVLRGNISYQITGLHPFTDLPFSTIGNDWGLPKILLSKEQRMRYTEIAEKIGEKLRREGWRGLYGIDVILDEETRDIRLLEVNARQPASTTFESVLQQETDKEGVTVFEAHLAALLGVRVSSSLTELRTGAQILQRITTTWRDFSPRDHSKLLEAGFAVVRYENEALNSEALRIQSRQSILRGHREWNENGERIRALLPQNFFTERTMSERALRRIDAYLHLPVADGTPCPYFNNKRQHVRFTLPAFVGKGSPEAISEEATVLLRKKHIDEKNLTAEKLSEFLVTHNLGIDCSGFVYHVLEAETGAKGKRSLRRVLRFPNARPIIGTFFNRLRAEKNTDVSVLAENSVAVDMSLVSPGDIIVILGAEDGVRNHVMLIHKVRYEGTMPRKIFYTHSISWPEDGRYGGGVRQGEIEILDMSKPLTDQVWVEQGVTGDANGTLRKARSASSLTLRRLAHLT